MFGAKNRFTRFGYHKTRRRANERKKFVGKRTVAA